MRRYMSRVKISGLASVRIENAVAQLRADHRQIETCFSRYYSEEDEARWSGLIQAGLVVLKVHMEVEEDIFYPALLAAKNGATAHQVALAEHATAKKLIADLENYDPGGWHYETKVQALWKMVQAHMASEESRGGMLDAAQLAGIDLLTLGQQITLRREELLELFSRQ